MWRVWGKREMHIGFWYGSLKERDYLEDPGIHGKITFKTDLKNWMAVRGLDSSGSG
jgi:hypothetical protein